MMGYGKVSMSGVELFKYRIIMDYIEGRLSRVDVATKLKISERTVSRYSAKVGVNGPLGVRHGLFGKPSHRKFSEEVKTTILELWKSKYKSCGFNYTHFTQKLNEVENIQVHRETVRKLICSSGEAVKSAKRGRKHRKQRERKARVGDLIQIDTSPHDWMGTGEKYHLVVAVDDATSELLHAELFESDGTVPNMTVMKSIFLSKGLPMAIYTDKASWFFHSGQSKRLQTFKAIHEPVEVVTQIERSLKALGVEFIAAHSPQAKGRVERMNGTLQDRLIAELKLHKITILTAANRFIREVFIPDHNKRYAVEPAESISSFVPLLHGQQIDEILCLEYESTVQKDNTVSKVNKYKLQLLPTQTRQSWVQAKVIVRILLNGSVIVRHKNSKENIPHEILELHKIRQYKHTKQQDLEGYEDEAA